MPHYLKPHACEKTLNINEEMLCRWANEGKINFIKTPWDPSIVFFCRCLRVVEVLSCGTLPQSHIFFEITNSIVNNTKDNAIFYYAMKSGCSDIAVFYLNSCTIYFDDMLVKYLCEHQDTIYLEMFLKGLIKNCSLKRKEYKDKIVEYLYSLHSEMGLEVSMLISCW